MDSLILGLVAIVVGAVVAAYGTRGFFILLPLWGFVTGFLLGGQVLANLLGEGLFVTVLGWVLGFIVGAVFAVLAGLWWWAAVIILTGVVGYEIGSGLLVAIGVDPGFLPAVAGVALAIVFAIVAIVLDAPTLYVAAITAIGGAAYAVAGFYLMFNQITIEQLKEGPVGALEGKPIALIVWAALAVVGFGFQWLDTRRIAFERIDRARYRYS